MARLQALIIAAFDCRWDDSISEYVTRNGGKKVSGSQEAVHPEVSSLVPLI
jgi:hypothetical protein